MRRLTAEQRAAVAAGPGPVRVVAGPGTGKTEVLVERCRRLVRDGVDPGAILVMTFTERAAAEMRSRLDSALGAAGPAAVGTFHALAHGWLRQDGELVGVPAQFEVLAGPDRWILAWEAMWRLADPLLTDVEHPELQVTPLLRTYERLKQELVPLARLEAWARRAADRERADRVLAATRLYRAYARECRRRRRLDFEDLLERAVRLLATQPAARSRYQARYRWLLVDEYQDLNLAQERIVELLAGATGRVFVVGDDDQSIYRFRGASRASMERFAQLFPAAVSVPLGRNRRSPGPVVSAATALIEQNRDRLAKPLAPARRQGPPVELWQFADGTAEAAGIAARARELWRGDPALTVAVLARTNAIAAPLARSLEAAGLPVRTAGWWRFFERPPVKGILAALRALQDPGDAVAGERLGQGFGQLDASLWRALADRLRPAARREALQDLFFELMSASGYLEGLAGPAAAAALRFADLVAQFCERSPDQSLAAFLEYVELVQLSGLDVDLPEPEEPPGRGPAVQVMTIHQAKGLEFDAVFVPALVEGRLPQPPRRDAFALPTEILEPAVRGREDHVAEERRLLYVAMTRARSRLVVSWAERYEGQRRWRRSPFLAEIEAGAKVAGGAAAALAEPATALALPAVAPVPVPRGRALSYSSIATYRECPRRFWFRYERGIRGAVTPEAHLGNAVHAALQAGGDRRRRGDRVESGDLLAELDRAWAREPFPARAARREAVYRALAGRLVAGYVEAGGFTRRVFHVEHPFATDMGGWQLRGVIDRVDAPDSAGGAHVLVDYKTGAAAPASQLRRDLQLALYAYGAHAELGLEPLELEIVYLREGRAVRLPASAELLEAAAATAHGVAGEIAAGRFPAQPEPRRCRSCAYRLACDAAL